MMRGWWLRRICCPIFTRQTFRYYSSQSQSQNPVETVAVRCASSGSITVNLHNIYKHHPLHPLVIYLPPFSRPGLSSPTTLPPFLQAYPTAVINYRWLNPSDDGPVSPSSQWPFPIHDTLFGYSWILENLAPADTGRRDVYVYGSYLGAGLAAGLALTESHSHQRMAVRGIMAYNGIYNWTMFLPDHHIHRNKSFADMPGSRSSHDDHSYFRYLKETMPTLFASPSHLFDPFASPSLLFHNPGLLVPEEFDTSALPDPMTSAIDALSRSSSSSPSLSDGEEEQAVAVLRAPRKGYLAFPPRHSTLKIPEALLMYEPTALRSGTAGPRRRKRRTAAERLPELNNFETQAAELVGLMRRSIDKLELRDRKKWDVDYDGFDGEALRRVEMRDVGSVELDGELGQHGQDIAAAWLEERLDKRFKQ